MGWSVRVRDFVAYTADCAEYACKAEFPIRFTRSEAEQDVEEHRAEHERHWKAMNQAWETQANG